MDGWSKRPYTNRGTERFATSQVKTLYIEPGSPWENGYVESLNGKLRDELLNREVFDTLHGSEGAHRSLGQTDSGVTARVFGSLLNVCVHRVQPAREIPGRERRISSRDKSASRPEFPSIPRIKLLSA
ncbi:MAG: hypothetical protein JW395_1086 [Nitrospira sp.]|nr:hypothetical protein [Nitrospira sp.]